MITTTTTSNTISFIYLQREDEHLFLVVSWRTRHTKMVSRPRFSYLFLISNSPYGMNRIKEFTFLTAKTCAEKDQRCVRGRMEWCAVEKKGELLSFDLFIFLFEVEKIRWHSRREVPFIMTLLEHDEFEWNSILVAGERAPVGIVSLINLLQEIFASKKNRRENNLHLLGWY